MPLSSLLEKARVFASEKHATQKRKFTGEPYIVHPQRVAATVKLMGGNETQLAAALLHDTLEDTDTTQAELLSTFGPEITAMVKALTNEPAERDRMGKDAYMKMKIMEMDAPTLLVKLADRLDNVTGMLPDNAEWNRRYSRSTQKILEDIDRRPILTAEHRSLIDSIRREIEAWL